MLSPLLFSNPSDVTVDHRERIVVPLSSRAVNTTLASRGLMAVSVTRTASEPSAGTSIGAWLSLPMMAILASTPLTESV